MSATMPHPANPRETLHAYNLTLAGGQAGTNNSVYIVTCAFAIQPQTVVSPDSSPILPGGAHFTIIGQSDMQTYIGTATDAITGKGLGFIFENSTAGKYILFSEAPHVWSGTPAMLHASTGVNDPNPTNWELNCGTPASHCFMAGTAVMTPDGEVPVESLKNGDLVTLSDGRVAPISWIGVQTVSTRFADPLRVLPVRIAAGALGEALPRRDLLISPDHAILLDDVLVQAGALVNGTTITRETQVPEVFRYYHIEIADHSLVLVEGVAAETFVDHVSRMDFDNWHEHAEPAPVEEMQMPRVKSARQLPLALRGRLLALAAETSGTGVAA